MVSFSTHVSEALVTIGLITVLYNFNFEYLVTNLRRPSQKKCTERNTYRIEHQMCSKVLQTFSVVPLLPNDCIPTFWKVHDTRQVCRTVELSDATGNGSRKVLQRRETHTTHIDFQFWEQVEVRGTHVGDVGWMG